MPRGSLAPPVPVRGDVSPSAQPVAVVRDERLVEVTIRGIEVAVDDDVSLLDRGGSRPPLPGRQVA